MLDKQKEIDNYALQEETIKQDQTIESLHSVIDATRALLEKTTRLLAVGSEEDHIALAHEIFAFLAQQK